MEKYGKDGPFLDPVLRCDKCNRILLKVQLEKDGGCPHCANRRIRNLCGFNLLEYLKMRFIWKIDPEFLKIFTTKKDKGKLCEKV
jgi:hypothetical protein